MSVLLLLAAVVALLNGWLVTETSLLGGEFSPASSPTPQMLPPTQPTNALCHFCWLLVLVQGFVVLLFQYFLIPGWCHAGLVSSICFHTAKAGKISRCDRKGEQRHRINMEKGCLHSLVVKLMELGVLDRL